MAGLIIADSFPCSHLSSTAAPPPHGPRNLIPTNSQRRWNRDRHRETGGNSSEKPFDLLAEGLLPKNSRGDCMAFELFLRGVEAWEDDVKRLIIARRLRGFFSPEILFMRDRPPPVVYGHRQGLCRGNGELTQEGTPCWSQGRHVRSSRCRWRRYSLGVTPTSRTKTSYIRTGGPKPTPYEISESVRSVCATRAWRPRSAPGGSPRRSAGPGACGSSFAMSASR